MLFEHHQQSFKSSKLIEGHPQVKRVSRRQSRLNQFKIPNPLTNTTNYINNGFVPNLPTSIKNQIAGVDYLTLSQINNIGKMQKSGPYQINKRNSRFSKRLMAMQKALQMQNMKMYNIEDGIHVQQEYNAQYPQNEGNYMSLMAQQRNSMQMQCMMGQNLDREMDMDFGLQMCNQQSQITQIQYYSQTQIRPQINYNEYQSYLNV